MLGIRIAAILTFALLAGCSRRWEEKTYEAGSFSVVEHWIKTEYWMLESRSGVEYTEICNKAISECHHNSSGKIYHDRKPRTAWMLVAKDKKYVALYFDNVDGRLLYNPIISIYRVNSGEALACEIGRYDDLMKSVTEADYLWRGVYGVGGLYARNVGRTVSKVFLVDINSEKNCRTRILREYGNDVELGDMDLDPASRETAWSLCRRQDCEVVTVNISSNGERHIPFKSCKSAPNTGFVDWVDGKLQHTCSGGEDKKILTL